MKTENSLAKNLSAADNKAALDASCKRLLANKIILAWILKECTEEYKNCSVDDIAEKYIEGTPQIAQTSVHRNEKSGENIDGLNTEDSSITEGTVTYDIRFGAVVPNTDDKIHLIINIEAQNDFYPGYPLIKRGIYYCSRMISSQYETYFTESHYENIRKVYSIWICTRPPESKKNTIMQYSIKEMSIIGNAPEKEKNYDLLTAVMICLGDENGKNYDGIIKLLEVLLSSDKKPEEKKSILQNDFEIKMTKTLESEVSIMCNISKGVEERGIEKGQISLIKNLMKNMQWTLEQAMTAAGLTKEEQEKYSEILKK